MKKYIILICLMPLISFAGTSKENTIIATYQELCAKERDPIKRQSYCTLLEKSGQTTPVFNFFSKDTALV